MRRLILAVLIIGVVLFGACYAPPTPARSPTPAPASLTITKEQAFLKLMESVQSRAKTYEAKEYVALFFPPYASRSERNEELKAWIITFTTLRPEIFAAIESKDWFNVNAKEYFSALKEPTWVVNDDGRILPMGSALLIEAGIQRLNTNKMLKEPVPAESGTSEPSMQYKIVSFTLEGNGEYMFPIYLRNDQTLNISWFVKEGERVWFHIFTPSGKNLGFYENGQYANGTLSEGFCQGFTEGRTNSLPLVGSLRIKSLSSSKVGFLSVIVWLLEPTIAALSVEIYGTAEG